MVEVGKGNNRYHDNKKDSQNKESSSSTTASLTRLDEMILEFDYKLEYLDKTFFDQMADSVV